MSAERTIDIPPRASALISSLRGLGYSPEAAIADLIDNSITAGATAVELDFQWDSVHPTAAIFDNGCGMGEKRLAAAMQLGGDGPGCSRSDKDLGRFGLGLKTASLSQSSCVTVVSRVNQTTAAITMDVTVIAARGWIATIPDSPPDHPFVRRLPTIPSGTVVLWENIDELSGLSGLTREAFYLRLEEIRAYLGMVFHRFIGGDADRIAIVLNGRPVKAWDPFQLQHPATIPMPIERIRHAGSSLSVKPYVLPHRDRFANESEYEAAGGPGGWGARQGFYVYRGKRLIVAGSWLGLGGIRTWTRDESSRLARIQADLPTDMDRDWRIDVRKSVARPPGALRARLTAIAGRCRQEAREVFAFRGQGPRVRGAPRESLAVWLASPGPNGTQYRINRDHPVIVACREVVGSLRPLNAVLSLIERSVPVERIWLDVAESGGREVPVLDDAETAKLANQLEELGRILPARLSPERRIDTLLFGLPGDLTNIRAELIRRFEGHDG